MGRNPNETKPTKELADKLDRWARRIEPKLPDYIGHVSFYGSLKKALDNLPDLAFVWLRSRMPRQLDSIQRDFNDLYEKARDVDRQRSESPGASANILKCQAQVSAKNLAQKLRLIVKMPKENLAAEKPTEPEQEKRRSIIGWIVEVIIALALLAVCLYVFGVVTGIFIFAALLTSFHLLGWLEPIRAFIEKIVWPE